MTTKKIAVDVFREIDTHIHLTYSEKERAESVAILANAQAICSQLLSDLESDEWCSQNHWLAELKRIEDYRLLLETKQEFNGRIFPRKDIHPQRVEVQQKITKMPFSHEFAIWVLSILILLGICLK